MIACSQLKSIRSDGPPANPESTKNFGTALALSLRLGPGTALALSLRLGPGTALALSMRETLGTALALSMRFGTALALSANAGEAAQTNAIVPKRSVLYEVITAPITAKKQEAARALFNIVQVQGAADSCHRYQHFAYLGGGSYS